MRDRKQKRGLRVDEKNVWLELRLFLNWSHVLLVCLIFMGMYRPRYTCICVHRSTHMYTCRGKYIYTTVLLYIYRGVKERGWMLG